MGYFLLFEGMLDSVLVARDKYLAADGIMAPSSTKIMLAAFGDDEWYNDTVNFWNDVYGFKMTAMNQNITKDALVTVVIGQELLSDAILLQDIQTKHVTSQRLDFVTKFEILISKPGIVYAFCGWFDTYFEGAGIDGNMFSTSPTTKSTHWMQTLFILNDPLKVEIGDRISGTFECKKAIKNPRELDVTMIFSHSKIQTEFQQHFRVV
jgi:protein arginine N-methyltransferase 3